MVNEDASIERVLRRLSKGSAWFALSNVVQQGLGFLQLILVARILDPRQVGLLAIGWLAINALDVFSRSGASDAIIHARDDAESYLSTYFWIELGRGILLSFLAFALAPLVVAVFDEPDAYRVVSTLALVPLAKALKSPGILLLRRNIQFQEWGRFLALSSSLAFVVSCLTLLIWRRLDFFVYSLILGELLASAVSYRFAPYLPKFHFKLERGFFMLRYGRWLLGAGIVSYVAIYLDRYIIGTLASAAVLGMYTVSLQFGEALTYRISKVLGIAVQPAYARLQGSTDVARLYEVNFRLSAITFALVAAIIWAWLPLMIPSVLGEEWRTAIPVFSIFVITGYLRSLSVTGAPYFKGVGQPKKIFVIEVVRSVGLAILIVPAFLYGSLFGVALAVAVTSALQLILTLAFMSRDQCINSQSFISLLPPIGCTFILGLSLRHFYISQTPHIIYFALMSAIALVIFSVFVFLTERNWFLELVSLFKSEDHPP